MDILNEEFIIKFSNMATEARSTGNASMANMREAYAVATLEADELERGGQLKFNEFFEFIERRVEQLISKDYVGL